MTAPNLVALERVGLAFGTTEVLAAVSLGLAADDRVGVVGINGGGKSTLLGLLAGTLEPDTGRVTRRSGTETGALAQAASFAPGAVVRDVVVPPARFAAEHEWAGDRGVREVLDGLGLAAIGLDAAAAELSGGQRRRVALAAQLVHRTDLLLLDEPTNHLDVEGVAWLAGYLTARRGALVVVTHDRWFLDAVCTTTWEVGEGGVRSYEGGYAAYVLARAERDRVAAVTEGRRQNLLRKELAWLRRGPPARTSKPKFRIDAAQALIADEPEPRDRVRLQRFATHRLGRTVFELEQVTLRMNGQVLLDRVDWQLGPGDRVAVVGVNGSGKTSLLRLLTGGLTAETGRVVTGQTVRTAYLSQEVGEVPGQLRVLEAVREIGSSVTLGDVELGAGQLLERFGFAADRQWTPVADLSGGERRRLQLLRLLMAEPNVLLLDEPTNDLDIDTLTELEGLLDGWPGSLVVVSTTGTSSSGWPTPCWRCSATAACARCPAASRSTSPGVRRPGRRNGPRTSSRPGGRRPAPPSRSDPAPRRPSARRARSWPVWSVACSGWPSTSGGCWPSWPSTPPTTAGSPTWTADCARCAPSGTTSRTPGCARRADAAGPGRVGPPGGTDRSTPG